MVDRSFLSKYQLVLPALSNELPKVLDAGFVPSSKDVICGRGKSVWLHCGNRRFRVIIAMNLEKYLNASTKTDKSKIVTAIVDRVREGSPHGGFVKKDSASGRWVSLDDCLAREKVGHALRDAVALSKDAVEQSFSSKENRSSSGDFDICLVEAQKEILRRLSRRSSSVQCLRVDMNKQASFYNQ